MDPVAMTTRGKALSMKQRDIADVIWSICFPFNFPDLIVRLAKLVPPLAFNAILHDHIYTQRTIQKRLDWGRIQPME